jgi:hypothetical protein
MCEVEFVVAWFRLLVFFLCGDDDVCRVGASRLLCGY